MTTKDSDCCPGSRIPDTKITVFGGTHKHRVVGANGEIRDDARVTSEGQHQAPRARGPDLPPAKRERERDVTAVQSGSASALLMSREHTPAYLYCHFGSVTNLDEVIICSREDKLPRLVELDTVDRVDAMAVRGHDRAHVIPL